MRDANGNDLGDPIWTNQEVLFSKYLELGMGPRERGIHFALAMLCCTRNYEIDSDPQSLCDLLNGWDKSGDKVSLEEMQRLRPSMAQFFVDTKGGKWTLSPLYFTINDPMHQAN